MKQLKEIAEQILTSLSKQKTLSDETICLKCFGTGTETVSRIPSVSRQCPDCRTLAYHKYTTRMLSKIPAEFKDANLSTLKARPDLHPVQPQVVRSMLADPGGNYFFCGPEGCGKTYLLYALYAHVVTTGANRVICTTMNNLVAMTKEGFSRGGDMQKDWLRIADLQGGRRCSVFIDDIDKARATEFVGELIFAWIDAIYANKHQLVITSQLHPFERKGGMRSLTEHFEEADPRYARTIVRRIVNEGTNLWSMYS